jgi:hypothetical protein
MLDETQTTFNAIRLLCDSVKENKKSLFFGLVLAQVYGATILHGIS